MKNPPVHVSMAVDRGFERPLAVALASIAGAHQPGACEVSVLHGGLPADMRRRIEGRAADRLAIEWIHVDDRVVSGAHYPSFLSRASLYRLLLPDLLPARARTIYLDADTVVLGSLQALWDTELDGHILAAVREAAAPWAAGPSGTNWRELGLAPDSPYFNSGLLVLPLDLWRQERLGDKAFEFLRTFRPRWGDQCALNAVAAGRWLEVPRRWNLQTADVEGRGLAWALWRDAVEEAVADPAVVHFTERAKPWTPGASHPCADLWFRVLDQTSWAGWRPPTRESVRTRARVGARRLLRSTGATLSSSLSAAPNIGVPWGGGV